MREIHEQIFQYLYQKHLEDTTFCFSLRQSNRYERLDKGYWFNGNDDSLYFSFWTGSDWVNKTANIYILVRQNGDTQLVLSAKDSEKKAQAFHTIATILDFKQYFPKGKAINYWYKIYAKDGDKTPIHAIQEIIEVAKPKIDSLLPLLGDVARQIHLIRPEQDFFRDALQVVLRMRDIQQAPLITPDVKYTPFRLEYATLENIGHFRDASIDLSRQVTCLIGLNGTGKTTLLRAIALGLCGVDSEWIDTEKEPVQHLLRMEKETQAVSQGKITVHYSLPGSPNIVHFIDRGESKATGDLKPVRVISVYNDESATFPSVEDGKYFRDTLCLGFSQGVAANAEVSYAPSESPVDDAHNRPNINDVFRLIYRMEQGAIDQLEEWLATYLHPRSKALPHQKDRAAAVFEQVLVFLRSLTGDEAFDVYYNSSEVLIAVTREAPQGIPFQLLSQGYNNILGWVSLFMIRLSEAFPDAPDFRLAPAILLIDEIDTYLHPKWQRAILPALVEAFPNTQFVLTTHSPYVVGGLKKEQLAVWICEHEGDEVTVNEFTDFTPYGADLNRLSRRMMKTPERDEIVESMVASMLQAVQENRFEEAENLIAQAKATIDPSDPDIAFAERLMRTRKVLAKP